MLLIFTKQLATKLNWHTLLIGEHEVTPATLVRNIGVIMDTHASMEAHANNVSRSAYYHLYNIGRIRCYLSQSAAEQLVHAFITSMLEYCNAPLLCGVLYCIVLYCIVLYCIVLYCIVLYCIVLYCIVLYCIVLYCIVLYCIVLYCIVLYCIVLYCIVFYFILLYFIVFYCIVLYCIVLYCIVLYGIVL